MSEKIYGLKESSIPALQRAIKVTRNLVMPSIPASLREESIRCFSPYPYPYGRDYGFGYMFTRDSDAGTYTFTIAEGWAQDEDNAPYVVEEKDYVLYEGSSARVLLFMLRNDTKDIAILDITDVTDYLAEDLYYLESQSDIYQTSTAEENLVSWDKVKLLYCVEVSASNQLTKVLRLEGATLSPKPDTIVTEGTENVQRSLSMIETPAGLQIFQFDEDFQVVDGLQDLLEANPVTGELSPMGDAERYELLVRVKSTDGSVRAIGYMPLGVPVNPEDPTKNTICGEEPFPGDVDPLTGEAPIFTGDTEEETLFPGGGASGGTDYEPDSEFIGKTNKCW